MSSSVRSLGPPLLPRIDSITPCQESLSKCFVCTRSRLWQVVQFASRIALAGASGKVCVAGTATAGDCTDAVEPFISFAIASAVLLGATSAGVLPCLFLRSSLAPRLTRYCTTLSLPRCAARCTAVFSYSLTALMSAPASRIILITSTGSARPALSTTSSS